MPSPSLDDHDLKQCHPLIRTRNRAAGGKNRLGRAGAGARAKIGRVRYIIIGAGAVGGTQGAPACGPAEATPAASQQSMA
jgi:hypothetical protein